jgi:hypothetical protein
MAASLRRAQPYGALVLALSVLAGGCDTGSRWALEAETAYPAALDFWPEERVFLAGSYHEGTIYRLPSDAKSVPAVVMGNSTHGHGRALRLKVDSTGQRLWVLDTDAVYAYALPDGRLLHRIPLAVGTRSRKHCLPDMALDGATGDVYVSDAGAPVIHRIAAGPGGGMPQATAIPVSFGADGSSAGGFSALTVQGSPPFLIAGEASSGKLWRVDPASGAATVLPVPPIVGVCGMGAVVPEQRPYLYRPPRTLLLYVTTGFTHRVLRVTLAHDFRSGEIARIAPAMTVDTPISVVAFSRFVAVTGSRLGRHGDFNGGRNEALPPFRLVLMPSGLEALHISTRR